MGYLCCSEADTLCSPTLAGQWAGAKTYGDSCRYCLREQVPTNFFITRKSFSDKCWNAIDQCHDVCPSYAPTGKGVNGLCMPCLLKVAEATTWTVHGGMLQTII